MLWSSSCPRRPVGRAPAKRLAGPGPLVNPAQVMIDIDRLQAKRSLAAFVRMAWPVIEPNAYVHGWHIDALCEHLEAITDGVELPDGSFYNRLLVNIPPGTAKSMIVSVLWPCWEWGPAGKPHSRFLCVSHSQRLAVRDNMRSRRLILSEWYQARWPVKMVGDQNEKMKFENDQGGWREAAAAGSITGSRGDRVVLDDPHSVEGAASEQMRQTTIEWFLEALPTRMNDPVRSAIVVIMQRLHEEDVSGVILEKKLGYDHLCLPMRATLWRRAFPTLLGYVDPRTEEGELLFPERFPEEVVKRDERAMGQYAVAGQFQQEPAPRGGGVIKREWWQAYIESSYPPMSFIIASLDTAYTEKTENDPSALTVWGVTTGAAAMYASRYVAPGGRLKDQDAETAKFDEAARVKFRSGTQGGDLPRVILMDAWTDRLELHELVERVTKTCRKMKVDKLLIENKASGYSVAQEIRRLFGHEDWAVQLLDPLGQDKLARLYSVQHLFEEGMIFAPDKAWADAVITQAAVFPKGKHDDLVDTTSMALRHLRELGLLTRAPEWTSDIYESMRHSGKPPGPIYPA